MTTRHTTRSLRLVFAAFAVLASTTAVSAQQSASYEVVSSFDGTVGAPIGVIQAHDGRFYGTTVRGADNFLLSTIGSVFVMDAAGARTTLKIFQESFSPPFLFDGTPASNLFEGIDGNLYGTTYNLAASPIAQGHIFRISPTGAYTRLATGAYEMRAGVIQARDGRLYGTADGTHNASFPTNGTVYRIEGNNAFTTLHSFPGTDTAYPVAELVEADDGLLYGTTIGGTVYVGDPPPTVPGSIFSIDPATGVFDIRHRFTDGSRPVGRLIQGSNGLLYGTTVNGGDFGLGTVFSFDRAGTLTTLHHFAGDDGSNPNAGVIQGIDGRLYGNTTNGGAFGQGTVFVINITGGLTTLHDFTLSDGANPTTELIQASDGAFYGAAPKGGPLDGGAVFRIRLETSPPPAGEFFEIVSRNNGKCLDVFGASTDAGASVIQWVCHGGPNQQWRLEPIGGGAVRIIARHSGLALDVFGASLDDVAPIIQWPTHGGDNQSWTLAPAGDGYVTFIARHSGKAMDVEFASPDDGARVIQYTPHGGANQQWRLRPVASTGASVTTLSAR